MKIIFLGDNHRCVSQCSDGSYLAPCARHELVEITILRADGEIGARGAEVKPVDVAVAIILIEGIDTDYRSRYGIRGVRWFG